MPKIHQNGSLLSPQELKLFRRIEKLCNNLFAPSTINEPTAKVLTNFPLSGLVDEWSKYARKRLQNILPIEDVDLLPNEVVRWPSSDLPLFRWENKRAHWAVGNNHVTSVWDSRKQKNTDFWKDRRRNDPAAIEFFEAIDTSNSEEEFNRKLSQHYLVGEESNYSKRRNILYSQSVDLLITADIGFNEPLMMDFPHSCIKPFCVIEHDGMVGSRIVDGDLRWSEDAVGKTLRNWNGEVDVEAVEYRIMKMNDKLAVLKDVMIPATVTNHDSLFSMSDGRLEIMMAEVSAQYLMASAMFVNPPVNQVDPLNEQSRWNLIANHCWGSNYFQTLRMPLNSNFVLIERVTTPLNLEVENPMIPFTRNVVQQELHFERMQRFNKNPEKFYFSSKRQHNAAIG